MFKYLMLLFVTKNTSYDKICIFSVNAFCLILSLSIYKITKQLRTSFLIFFISILFLNFLFYYQATQKATQIKNSDKITKERYNAIKEINDWVMEHFVNNIDEEKDIVELFKFYKECIQKNINNIEVVKNIEEVKNIEVGIFLKEILNIFSKIKEIKFEEIKNIEEFWAIKLFVFYNENQNAKELENSCISMRNPVDYQYQEYQDLIEFNTNKIAINYFIKEISKIVKESDINYEDFLKELQTVCGYQIYQDQIKFFKSLLVGNNFYHLNKKSQRAVNAMKEYKNLESNCIVLVCHSTAYHASSYEKLSDDKKNEIKNEFNTWKAS